MFVIYGFHRKIEGRFRESASLSDRHGLSLKV